MDLALQDTGTTGNSPGPSGSTINAEIYDTMVAASERAFVSYDKIRGFPVSLDYQFTHEQVTGADDSAPVVNENKVGASLKF